MSGFLLSKEEEENDLMSVGDYALDRTQLNRRIASLELELEQKDRAYKAVIDQVSKQESDLHRSHQELLDKYNIASKIIREMAEQSKGDTAGAPYLAKEKLALYSLVIQFLLGDGHSGFNLGATHANVKMAIRDLVGNAPRDHDGMVKLLGERFGASTSVVGTYDRPVNINSLKVLGLTTDDDTTKEK